MKQNPQNLLFWLGMPAKRWLPAATRLGKPHYKKKVLDVLSVL